MRLVVFGRIWQCWIGAINAQVCNMKSFSNFSQRTHPIHPHLTINSCLCASRSVWVYLAIFRYYMKLGAKWVELVQLMHKFASEFFAMNGPDPPYWTIISCFRASRSVWVHLAMFHYYMKLVGKQVELVQLMHKFVPWSRFRIFRNERTQSTPIWP